MSVRYRPPSQPPPPNLPPRRSSPPRVNRAGDASETLDDENGEAPPAYEDAVAAGPNGVLPPQRRDEHGHLMSRPTGNTSNGSNSSNTNVNHLGQSNSQSIGGPFASHSRPPFQHQAMNNHPLPMSAPYHQPNDPRYAGYQSHYAPPSTHIIPYGARPPPGALVLQPGDPRIGGQLCYQCGGAGLIQSLFFGDETCHRCRGSGRVF